ncbi:MAG: diphthamide synthesis protein [Nanoarchaeota archaeon]
MFNLELNEVIDKIKASNAKQVLIQLPDGLKHKSNEVVDFIEENTDAKAFILLGSCFGACDIPLNLNLLNIDLIIQWGHNRFNKEIW